MIKLNAEMSHALRKEIHAILDLKMHGVENTSGSPITEAMISYQNSMVGDFENYIIREVDGSQIGDPGSLFTSIKFTSRESIKIKKGICAKRFMHNQINKYKIGKEIRCSENLLNKIKRMAIEQDVGF